VVGRARVDDGRLRRRPVHLVAVGEGQRRQQGREEEAGRARGDELEQSEGWNEKGRGNTLLLPSGLGIPCVQMEWGEHSPLGNRGVKSRERLA